MGSNRNKIDILIILKNGKIFQKFAKFWYQIEKKINVGPLMTFIYFKHNFDPYSLP